jgi:hypothetical protein
LFALISCFISCFSYIKFLASHQPRYPLPHYWLRFHFLLHQCILNDGLQDYPGQSHHLHLCRVIFLWLHLPLHNLATMIFQYEVLQSLQVLGVREVRKRTPMELLINFVRFRMYIARSNVHFTTITGQEEWVTTLDATLPSSTLETPDLPLVPTTIILIL